MDSITQIALGAAVAEVVAGKKLGNRAILWGAVAGTIPDLDVLANLVVSDLDALAFHRGFFHSILFAILGAFVFAWLVQLMYHSRFHRFAGALGWSIILFLIYLFFNFRTFSSAEFGPGFFISTLLFLVLAFFIYRRYGKHPLVKPDVTLKTWRNLFFWSIFTHPILDCFTVFGTQLFQPFSSYRVSFDNISVADPMYTIPLLFGVLIASFMRRGRPLRRIVNLAGIFLSSAYMIFTIYNKQRVNKVFLDTLRHEHVAYNRYMSNPTILNNILWYACAETDSSMFIGLYSLFDKEHKFQIAEVPKNHHFLEVQKDDRTLRILQWFSNDYYTIMKRRDGRLQFNDMRYGTFDGNPGSEDDYIFKFILDKNEKGFYEMEEPERGPRGGSEGEMFQELVKRIRGI